LLLSAGKDNRTICWNPQTGQQYGEFPIVTNWTFQTRWNPHNPSFFATASFDGEISIQTIQNTRSDATQITASQNHALDGEDFFTRAQTQPQVSTFSLPKAPKWLERPVSASFGFGGRVLSIRLIDRAKRSSEIKITQFEVDSAVRSAAEVFENALNEGNLRSICESRISAAKTGGEKIDWKVIETLISDNPRKSLVEYLGFLDVADEAADGLAKLESDKEENNGVSKIESRGPGAKRHKRLTSIFDANPEGDSFLTDLAASKGARTNDPFQIYTGSESEADRRITRALLLGQFEKALEACLREDRLSDAFMIAICGGQSCIEKVQEAYFSKQSGGPNYLRLLASIVGKNLWDVVHNADLSSWKEVMAALCTFASEKDFPDLCEALGDRLDDQTRNNENKAARKDASLCYLAGSKLEKVIAVWADEFQEYENEGTDKAADDSSFSIHVRALQHLIEKVTIFRQVTKYQDTERQKKSDWKLSVLYDKYVEYADVVATHGRLDIAEKYLALVPDNYPEADVARNRIKLASRKAATSASQPAATSTTRSAPNPLSQSSVYQPSQPAFGGNPIPAVNPYAPSVAQAQSTNPYASFTASGYAPANYQSLQPAKAPSVPPPPQSFSSQPLGSSVAPPTRAFNQSPATVASYTTASNLPAWNDLPEGFGKPSTSRRGTPSGAGVIGSPFPNQPPSVGEVPPPTGPQIPTHKAAGPPPPPPKGSALPPRMTSPPSVGPPRPSSVSSNPPPTNPYALRSRTPPAIPGMAMPPPVPRGPSPYNAPPAGPPSGKYAPNPVLQQSMPQLQTRPPVRSPPQAAAGPHAPQQFQQQPSPMSNPYAPPSASTQPHLPQPPAQISRPSTAQSQAKPPAASRHRESSAQSSDPRLQLANTKFFAASGDRSHIPANAMPILEILSADMQRVKARAPASFKAQVDDAERRLDILFDHLNNEDLLKPNTVADMVALAKAMQARDYETARNIHLNILTDRTDECGNWMVSFL
jgi:protein transport protein SEC31